MAGAITGGTYGLDTWSPDFFGSVPSVNPDIFKTAVSGAQASAQQEYYKGLLQYQNERLAFEKAQQAFNDYMSMASQFGVMPGVGGSTTGNYFSWPPNPTAPQYVGYHANSSGTFQPSGYANLYTAPYQAQQYQQLQGQAQNRAAATGVWQQPIPEEWLQGTMPTWDQIESYMLSVNPNWDNGKAKEMLTRLVNETPETFHGNYPLTQLTQADLQRVIQVGGGTPQTPTMQLQSLWANLANQQAQLLGTYNQPSSYAPGTYVQDPTSGKYFQVQNNGQLAPVAALPAGQTAVQGPAGVGSGGGQTTLAAQEQYFSQAFREQQANQAAVQNYLQLLSQLRGPQDYGQYLRVLASTPGGLTSLAQAAAGNGGRVPYFGTTGAPTQAATAAGMVGATPGAGGGTTPAGTSYDEYMRTVQGLPPPSQIAPQNWNAMSDSQKQLLMGMYEAAGWNVTDALQQYKASLPKFSGTSGSVRLV